MLNKLCNDFHRKNLKNVKDFTISYKYAKEKFEGTFLKKMKVA